jgi:hypothetical protein
MVKLYSNDFVFVSKVVMRHQLRTYVRDVRQDTNFTNLKDFQIFVQNLLKQISAAHMLWFISF